jgi:tetratricopeptide (TPR) repeat protein
MGLLLLIAGCGTADPLAEAEAALDRGDQPAAIAALRRHLERAPDASETRLKLASLLRDGQPVEALELLEEIPSTDPARIAAVQQIAVIHLVAGRTLEAEQALKEVVSAQPENFGARLSLAELYFQAKAFEAALPHALEARRLQPDRAQTCLLLAEIHDELHDPAAMIEPLEAAIRIDPDYYEARLNLAYASYKTGALDVAAEQAKWCVDRNPADVAAIRTLGLVARDEGRYSMAKSYLSRALALAPDDVDCRILEADLLLYERQPEAAYNRLKAIYPKYRETVRYLGALARAAASAGKRDESRSLYQSVEKLLNPPGGSPQSQPPQGPVEEVVPR